MKDDAIAKKLYKWVPPFNWTKPKGRPNANWGDCTEKSLRKAKSCANFNHFVSLYNDKTIFWDKIETTAKNRDLWKMFISAVLKLGPLGSDAT